jgi:hypothetical protein
MKREFTRLPSLEVAKEFEGLAKLIEEHQKVLSAFRQNKAEYEQLELERKRARNRDGVARVAAYRSGEKDPGAKHEAAVIRKMERLEDRQTVLERAYQQIEGEIGHLVSKERHAWLPKVEGLIHTDDQELAGLLGQLGDCLKRRQAHAGLHGWIAELPPGYHPKVFVQGGFSEDVAYNFLRSTIGKTIKNDDDEVEAIGA